MVQTPRSTTSHILQRGCTTTPARCWATLYGADGLSVSAAKAVSLCLARHLSACLFHVSASGAIIAAATANHRRFFPTKSLQNSCFIGRAWPNFEAFYRAFRKNPNKNVPQVSVLCLLVLIGALGTRTVILRSRHRSIESPRGSMRCEGRPFYDTFMGETECTARYCENNQSLFPPIIEQYITRE